MVHGRGGQLPVRYASSRQRNKAIHHEIPAVDRGLRYQIACLRDHGLSQARIAKQLRVHPSTISRELRRNCAGQAYQPQQAHQLATATADESEAYCPV